MERAFWQNRWESSDTNFDSDLPHRYITRYYQRFVRNEQSSVFFPLCGKSVDMLWAMQQGNEISGIEISDIPIKRFFSEFAIEHHSYENDNMTVYEAKSCKIIEGDIFNFTPSKHIIFQSVYDRGSFVALPSETMRDAYVQWLKDHTKNGTRVLLITNDFDQDSKVVVPPFPVSDKGLEQLFSSHFSIEKLADEVLEPKQKWKLRGVKNLKEKAFLLIRK